MKCNHDDDLKQEELENGEWIEVCNDCGMSRSIWEWGSSDWMMVDLDEVRKINSRLYFDLITAHYESNQAIIDDDYMECFNCGNIVLDPYDWLVPKCDNCNKNRAE